MSEIKIIEIIDKNKFSKMWPQTKLSSSFTESLTNGFDNFGNGGNGVDDALALIS